MIILVFVFGCIIGSFLNVVILRTHKESSINYPPSHCPHCEHVLSAKDLVPILSFLWLKGRCRYCSARISPQYPLVELATGTLAALLWWHAGVYATHIWIFLLRDFIVWTFFILLFVYDLRYMLVPDIFIAPPFAVALIANIVLGFSPWNLLLAAALLGGFFWLQLRISQGRWVGPGDILIAALIGVYLGLTLGALALWFSYVVGAVIVLVLLGLKKVRMGMQIPFGPFLLGGALLSFFFADVVLGLVGL